MKDVVFSANAYSKMILHAAKYPHCAINGVLLVADDKSNEKPKNITYVDAVPLFHLCLHVTPMAEIALSQIELWAEASGLAVAGYYLANENINDMSYDRPAHKIADKISEKFRSSCLVVIDNKLVTLSHDTPAIRTFQNVDGKWRQMDKAKVIVDDDVLDVTSTLLTNKVHFDVVDFDNHLDNISSDWKNTSLNYQVESILSDIKDQKS